MYETERKIALNFARNIQSEERFTGQFIEDGHGLFDYYESVANDYVLGNMHRFKYLQNLFNEMMKLPLQY